MTAQQQILNSSNLQLSNIALFPNKRKIFIVHICMITEKSERETIMNNLENHFGSILDAKITKH